MHRLSATYLVMMPMALWMQLLLELQASMSC